MPTMESPCRPGSLRTISELSVRVTIYHGSRADRIQMPAGAGGARQIGDEHVASAPAPDGMIGGLHEISGASRTIRRRDTTSSDKQASGVRERTNLTRGTGFC